MFKGLTLSFVIISFMLVGVPLLSMLAILGPEQYANYCVRAIHMPCFGLNK